jgi:4-amino-4-deoxy-L-arabinose transferase-like glycosyltransferase
MINIVAHSGEIHETAIESSVHSLAWYVQLPLAIFVAAGVFALLQLVVKNKNNALLIMSLLLLIAGFGLFSIAPLVSATAITTGMIVTLLVTLVGLGANTDSPKEKETKKPKE